MAYNLQSSGSYLLIMAFLIGSDFFIDVAGKFVFITKDTKQHQATATQNVKQNWEQKKNGRQQGHDGQDKHCEQSTN